MRSALGSEPECLPKKFQNALQVAVVNVLLKSQSLTVDRLEFLKQTSGGIKPVFKISCAAVIFGRRAIPDSAKFSQVFVYE